MVTQAFGWIVLASVSIALLIEITRGWTRLRQDRRVNHLTIERLKREIQDSRARFAASSARPTTAKTAPPVAWQGTRKFRVERKVLEADGCHSFYLTPHDGKKLPLFQPGQFLTFSIRLPDQSKPLVRCYSLSDAPRPDFYRCTIKQVLPGKVSTYFNTHVKEHDLLDVKAPRGSFTLSTNSVRPAIMIAAGVGITPLMSMTSWLFRTQSPRAVHLFYGVRNGREHIFKDELRKLDANYPALTVTTFYSQPDDIDQAGHDFSVAGRLNCHQIHERCQLNGAEYYLCGPGEFMRQLQAELLASGLPESDLHFEAFGPSSVKKLAAPVQQASNGHTTVRFDRSGRTVPWNSECGSLLELADQHNIPIEAGCRSGNCGTCATAVKSGRFVYVDEPTTDCEDGSCLPCICVPKESIVLDA